MASYSVLHGSVALITLQNPPVNALSAAVRAGITDAVQRTLKDPQVTSVVICGQNGRFCGGADIREFGGSMSGPPLVPMINAIEAMDKPVVAAIEGVALGGGLELALGCHYRIAHRQALVGLPEVTLGLLPAAGGSQRLPRLIGLPAALDLITTGKHILASEALKLGIVDQVTDGNALNMAVEFARRIVGKPLDPRRISTLPCPSPPDVDFLLDRVLAQVRKRARGALAPVACVGALRAAVFLPFAQGMEKERELMGALFDSGQARALQYAFFSQRLVSQLENHCCYWARYGLVPRHIAPEEILERCLYALTNEGFNILQDGMAAGPEDIDAIYVFGYGWPRHRGGPMFHAGQVGLARVLEKLEHYQHKHPDVPYLKPSPLLRRLVAAGSPAVQKWREFLNKDRVHSQL
ncbi:hypothetical protein DPEC_G00135330 [Dallia pectoralis]|uniref:Uncharacterized protein n=1 Tax=Dallia pectoralis TaxID=75939 RepID=A0ACC2GLK9_DALPE|nr:hypothetical protein DPEC_G00135330 [Dallia pectoralis]